MRNEEIVKTLIVVPIYNEEENCSEILDAVRKLEGQVLVIDDGSTDLTPEILQNSPGLIVIRHEANQGYGQSLIDAFEYAKSCGCDVVATLDCDAQHEPRRVPAFVAKTERHDIVSGSRYLPGSETQGVTPEDRARINHVITERINALTGYRLTDAFCGMKAYRVSALRKLHLTEPGYGMPLQLWIQAARAGLTIKELPVSRIYVQPERRFPGALASEEERLRYYDSVISQELAKGPIPPRRKV